MDTVEKAAVTSPQITHFSWGHLEIEGHGRFKDVKLYPGGVRAWDWDETGTRHAPGIQPADVEEVLNNGAQVIVLSKGVQEQLRVMDQTLEMLKSKQIEVYVLQTEQAIEHYNRLAAEGKPVGALIHSTC